MKTNIDLDISMGNKYTFAYEYLDETRSMINGSDYRLYFVLLGDKYKIFTCHVVNNILIINCINESSNDTYCVEIDIFGSFKVDSDEYMNISVIENGNVLMISYNDRGIEHLKQFYPEEYEICSRNIEKHGVFLIKIHVKNLIQMSFAANKREYVLEYQVLYIGRSKQKDIFDRIESHRTIQKIHRELGKQSVGKSIEIMLCDVYCKIIDRTIIEKYNAEMVMSSSLGNTFNLFEAISRNEAIDIAEAILIAHFKPSYNNNMKNIDVKLKTYSKFKDVEISSIHFSLDLYWERVREKSVLYTDSMKTETKARVITCTFKNNDIEYEHYDLDDIFY